jgi:hypothetical protein
MTQSRHEGRHQYNPRISYNAAETGFPEQHQGDEAIQAFLEFFLVGILLVMARPGA